MANLYNTTTTNNNISSSSSPPPHEPDDISLFLQQIILRSSSSSSSFMRHQSVAAPSDHLLAENRESVTVPGPGRIYVPEGLNPSSGCSFTARAAAKLDNEADEYDYESEEVVEALVEETARKQTGNRSSCKRSRAAEVHNLSEKRRRSRINEKMKALQNLIPNSNKTDKASMLDEAIEYLKQLQLQVQMLTMRNGLSLYPICLPGMLQPNQNSQTRVDIYDSDKSLNVNTTKAISVDQNISANALLRLQDSCVKQAPVTDFSTMIGSKTSFELEPSTRHHFGSFQISRSSEEKVLPCQPLNDDCPQTSSAGASKATSSIPFETEISNLKENTLEVCIAGGDHLLPNFVTNPIFSSQLNM